MRKYMIYLLIFVLLFTVVSADSYKVTSLNWAEEAPIKQKARYVWVCVDDSQNTGHCGIGDSYNTLFGCFPQNTTEKLFFRLR